MRGLSGSYEEKLQQCGLTLLADRRVRGDMIQTYKIVNQINDIPIETFFKIADHSHATRTAVTVNPGDEDNVANMNFVKPKAKGDIRKNFFSHRVVDTWNNLPASVKAAESVNSFKNLYDKSVK